MTDATQASTPAGWYPDPAGSPQLRWWSGAGWTEHLAPAAPVATPAVASVVAPAGATAAPAAASRTATTTEVVRAAPVFATTPVFTPAPAEQVPAYAASASSPSAASANPSAAAQAPYTPVFTASSASPAQAPGAPLNHVWNPNPSGALETSYPERSRGGYFPGTTGVRGSGGPSAALSPAWNRPERTNTAAAWALGLFPLWSSIFGFVIILVAALLIGMAGGSSTITDPAVRSGIYGLVGLLTVVFLVAFVLQDRKQLVKWGYQPASAWWILLGPLVYLIARTVVVRRVAGRGGGPLWTYLGILGATVAGYVALFTIGAALLGSIGLGGFGVGGSATTISSAALQRGIQSGINSTGKNFTVTCPPTVSTVIGTQFTCTAIDNATSHTYNLLIDVVADPATGRSTVKLHSTQQTG